MTALTRTEAQGRAALLDVDDVTLELDLTTGPETFGSRSQVRFRARQAGETFLDCQAVRVTAISLDGEPLPLEVWAEGRIPLEVAEGEHVVEVHAVMPYSREGVGLHRLTDPADGQDYVWSNLALDAAPRVLACFDQPDLKPEWEISVVAPSAWTVVSNGDLVTSTPAEGADGVRHVFSRTRRFPTYVAAVCAGPWASEATTHDGIPLRVLAMASRADDLREQAPDLFDATRRAFDHHHEVFGIRYPYAGYDQVFVPEFNWGAMENPGCVVFRDEEIFRGAASHDQRLVRTGIIAHELAHMWVGNLVTMRWWDDLWLNESFAEYMAHRCLVDATTYTDAWVHFGMTRRTWGSAADRSPSTHPIAPESVEDTKDALQNFDGISYAKGASVLRQLVAHIGDEAFLAGIRDHLSTHAWGNATLADFLDAMGRSSGTDLRPWARSWLERAGLDRLSVDRATGTLRRDEPATPAGRPHTLDVLQLDGAAATARHEVVLPAGAPGVEIPGLAGAHGLVLPNAADLTWAQAVLDEESLAGAVEALVGCPDETARGVLWQTLLSGVATADVDPRLVVSAAAAALPGERNESILAAVATQLGARLVPVVLPAAERPAADDALAEVGRRLLAADEPGRRLVGARLLARHARDVECTLLPMAAGRDLPEELRTDDDLRWSALIRASALGGVDADRIEAAAEVDPTVSGRQHRLTALAAMPDAKAKEMSWLEMTTDRTLSAHEAMAIARGLWLGDPPLADALADRWLVDVPTMSSWMRDDALARLATASFPADRVDGAFRGQVAQAAARDDLSAGIRRVLIDQGARLDEALASRERFGG